MTGQKLHTRFFFCSAVFVSTFGPFFRDFRVCSTRDSASLTKEKVVPRRPETELFVLELIYRRICRQQFFSFVVVEFAFFRQNHKSHSGNASVDVEADVTIGQFQMLCPHFVVTAVQKFQQSLASTWIFSLNCCGSNSF